MEVELLGEHALIVRGLPESPITAAEKFRRSFGDLLDIVPCYETVGLYFDGLPPDQEALVHALRTSLPPASPKRHSIPVCYEFGPDLGDASGQLGITPAELVRLHSERVYRCAAVGFTPGFAYLGDLDERIAKLARLDSPRPRVEAGSVAITGKQTAVYPSPSPGGWHLIGRTPLLLVDIDQNYFPIKAGDCVKFHPIESQEFSRIEGRKL